MSYNLSSILVTKRDGRKVPFDDTKICQAVKAAYLDNLPTQDSPIGTSLINAEKASSYAEYVMKNVLDKLEALEPVSLTIEQIQDIVVKTLLEDKSEVGKRVAENYISYRAKRTQIRTINSDINQAIKRILVTDSKDNDDKRENANINTDAVMGQMLKIGSTVTKEFNLNNLINEKYSNLHRQGKIHLHDLDFMSTVNCLHIPLDKLLKNGFSTGHGYLRTPTTIQSASSLTCIAIQSSQNDFFGGQSIPSLDYYLAPYVLKSFVRRLAEFWEVYTYAEMGTFKPWIKEMDEVIRSDKFFKSSLEEVQEFFRNSLSEWEAKNCPMTTVADMHFPDLAVRRATKATERDTQQAMEALVHNLCTMQCFPGYEDLWVYDRAYKQWCIYTFAELHQMFAPGRFLAMSVNPKTGELEMKEILDCVARFNDKEMVAVNDASGSGYISTFDHRYMTSNEDLSLGYTVACAATHTTMPRCFKIPTLNDDIGMDVSELSARGVRVNTPCAGHTFVPYTIELAELLGYWVADGWVSPDMSMVGFAVDIKVDPDHILNLFEKAFGFRPVSRIRNRVDQHGNERLHALMVSCGVHIGRCISRLAGLHADTKHIPNFVLSATEDVQNAFLSAYLTCDGGHHDTFLDFSTVSGSLVYDMKLLFLSRGEMLHVGVNPNGITPQGNKARPLYTCMLGYKAAERLGLHLNAEVVPAFEIPKYDNSDVTSYAKSLGIPWGSAPDRVTRRGPADVLNGGRQMLYSEIGELETAHAGKPGIEKLAVRQHVFNVPVTDTFGVQDEDIVYDISVADNENFMLAGGAVVHNSRAGSQTPFSSVNYGLDTSWAGRLVSKSLMDAIDAGLGLGETAIFPIAIMKLKKGITDKGSPNYDLFKQSCRVSAKRLFPNWVNVDAPFNLPYYKADEPRTHISSMGALAYGKVWLSILADDGQITGSYVGDISEAGDFLLQHPEVIVNQEPCHRNSPVFKPFDRHTFFLEIDPDKVKIADSYDGETRWVGVKKFMFWGDPTAKWMRIRYHYHTQSIRDLNNEIIVTEDHPLPVSKDNGETFKRVCAANIRIGDILKSSLVADIDSDVNVYDVGEIRPKGTLIGYDFETVSDHFDAGSIVSHNCRTRVISNDYDSEHVQCDGRGNLFWTTMNLPYLALEAKEELIHEKGLNYHLSDVLPDDLIPTLYQKIIEKVDTTVDDILAFSMVRYNLVANKKAKNFPFSMCQHEYVSSEKLGPEDPIGPVLKEGTISIGFIGLAETLIALTGHHHGESDLAQEYGLKLVKHMRERTDRATKEMGFNVSLMGSPAEGCTGRLCKLIKKRWGVLPDITDKDYLVNSSHLPPKFKTTITNKVLKEVPYHALENAGHILYCEIAADATRNLEGFEQIVTFMADKGAGYFAINHPVTRDPICGYVGPLRSDGTCPRCGRRSGEGVSVEKLLSLHAYSPDPEYAITAAQLDQDDAASNDVDF